MVDNITRLGTVIHLHSSLDGILPSIMSHPRANQKNQKRPLLQNIENAKTLYDTRLPLYREAASHSIDIEGRKIVEAAQ